VVLIRSIVEFQKAISSSWGRFRFKLRGFHIVGFGLRLHSPLATLKILSTLDAGLGVYEWGRDEVTLWQ